MKDEDFIGLSMQDALESCQAHDLACRIAVKEDKPQFLTDDIQTYRLNFVIKNGKVISVSRG